MNNIEKDIAKIPAPRVVFEAKESLKRGVEVVMIRRAVLWGSSVAAVVILGLHYFGIGSVEVVANRPQLVSQEFTEVEVAAEPTEEEPELVQTEKHYTPQAESTATIPQQKKAAEPTTATAPVVVEKITPQRIVQVKVGATTTEQYFAQNALPKVDMSVPVPQKAPERKKSRIKIDLFEMFKGNKRIEKIKPRIEKIRDESRIFFEEYLNNSVLLIASNDKKEQRL